MAVEKLVFGSCHLSPISPAIAGQLQHILDLDQFQNQVKKKLSRTRLRLKMSSITKI